MSFNFIQSSLKKRILSGYSIPIALSILTAGLVYVNVQKVVYQSQLLEEAHEIVDDVKDLGYNLQTIQRTTRGYLLEKSPVSRNAYSEAKENFEAISEELEEDVEDTQQIENLNRIIQLGETIEEFNQNLLNLVDQGQTNEAVEIWKTGSGREYADELQRLIAQFEEREIEIVEEQRTELNRTLALLTFMVIFSTLLSAVLMLVIGLWIASRITSTIDETVNILSSASSEIAATVEQQEKNTGVQAASVNQTTTTMDELSASSQQAAEQAEASVESAREVLSIAESSTTGAKDVLALAEGGTQTVDKTLQGIFLLKQKVEEIADSIQVLSEQTNQISTITTLVTDIAGQTNMLALNAAVEAARAGENGKGFSVVAIEIRKLADQSKASAAKINALTSDIQTSIKSTVTITERGKQEAETGIVLSQETAQAFVKVAESINEVILQNQEKSLEAVNDVVVRSKQISLTSQQQAVAIQQVVDAMNSISQGAVETAGGMSQTKVGTQRLNEIAQKLKATI